MRSQSLYNVRIAVAQIIDLLKGIRPSLFEHGEEFPEDPRSALRVVYCAVMVFQTYSHYFGNCVQCIFGVSGKDRSGYSQSIHRSEGAVSSLLSAVLPHKTDIKSDIVADQYTSFRKKQKSGQDLFDGISLYDHIVIDPGQLNDPVGDRYPGINEFREAACDLAVFYPDSAELDDPVLLR